MKSYPFIKEPPPAGQAALVCEDGHRTRAFGRTESVCTAEIRSRRWCNRRAILEVPAPW